MKHKNFVMLCFFMSYCRIFAKKVDFENAGCLIVEFSTKSLKYGFCKKLLLSKCNSDQLNIFWPFFSSLLGGCNSKATAKQHQTHPKVMTKMVRIAFGKKLLLTKSMISASMTLIKQMVNRIKLIAFNPDIPNC